MLGIEYLYSQTGRTLTVIENPAEEDRLVDQINDEEVQDEGFVEEDTEDITLPVLSVDDSSCSPWISPPQASPLQTPATPSFSPQPSTSRDGDGHPPPPPVTVSGLSQQPPQAPDQLAASSGPASSTDSSATDQAQVSIALSE